MVFADDCTGKAKIPENVLREFKIIEKNYAKANEKVSEIRKYIDSNNNKPCSELNGIIGGLSWKTREVFKQYDSTKLNNTDVKTFIGVLKTVSDSLEQQKTGNKPVDDKKEVTNGDNELKNVTLWKNIWKYLFLTIAAFVGLLYILAQFNKKMLSELLLIKPASSSQNNNDEIRYLKEQINTLTNEKVHLEDKIKRLEQKESSSTSPSLIEKVQDKKDTNQLENYYKSQEELNLKGSSTRQEIFVLESTFYLSLPGIGAEGKTIFHDRRESKYDQLKMTYYQFSLEKNSSVQRARFKFASENPNSVSSAIQFYDKYIDPACEYTIMNPKSTYITTEREGIAYKKGDVWVVERKAKIKFN
ncbi:hypothetical protein EGI22_16060 [Lacihabitans sp. LS3-19]|nr:hypothetical protein [Lacihabitans sp. LS3-19]